MATVFLAQDTRHRRKVAIKVLREDLAASVGESRFLREIEIAARLQHPHVLPLLDSGNAAGLLFYVMPFVDGHSLRDRLDREHELPISDAVRITTQVVDALAYAHAQGVIHRDIKPDNVMFSGRHAVVTDFGVAKAVTEASAASAGTVTSLGVALGTPAYMSPEQAAADPHVDHRADIYSVGALAYELLAGRPPFTGKSAQQLLAAHVTEVVDPISRHRPQVSPQLEAAIMRCLEKRAADRWQRADDLLAVLETFATPSGGSAPTMSRTAAVAPAARRRWPLPAAVLMLAVVAVGAWLMTRDKAARLAIGRSQQLTSDPSLEIHPAVSPDGKLVAYAMGRSDRTRIFVRPVGGGRTFPLSDDTTAMEFQPQWSPDGQWLLYLANNGASIAPALGGQPRAAVPASSDDPVTTATWSPDGSEIAFVRGDSLYRAAANGSTPRLLNTGTNQGEDLHSCAWSPNGKWIACVSMNPQVVRPGRNFGNRAPSAILVFPATGGEGVTVAQPREMNLSPVWAGDGRTLYFISNRDGPRDIYAVALGSAGAASGEPRRLTTGLNALSFSLSKDAKRLAYALYYTRANIWSLPIPAAGQAGLESARAVTTGNQTIESISISDDRKWITYDTDIRGNSDVFRIPMAGGEPEQLTSEPWDEFAGTLSPDNRHLAYHSFRNGSRDIEVKPLNGGAVELVTATTERQESFPEWSHDGRSLVFNDQAPPSTLYVVSRAGPGRWSAPRSLGAGVGVEWFPDGRRVLAADDLPPANTEDAQTARQFLFSMSTSDTAKRIIFSGTPAVRAFSQRLSRDGRTVYLKSHDAEGRASFWAIPEAGGPPRLLAHLSDPARPSSRGDFTVDDTRLYFTLDERQSDVFVADVQ